MIFCPVEEMHSGQTVCVCTEIIIVVVMCLLNLQMLDLLSWCNYLLQTT